MTNSESGIYIISFKSNPYFYIGKTKNFRGRKNSHLSDLRRNSHCNPKLQNVFNKYGESDFVFTPYLEIDSNDPLFDEKYTQAEQEMLDEYMDFNECLNIDPVSGISGVNCLSPEEKEQWRQNMSKGITNKWKDPDYRKNNLESRHGIFFADIVAPNGDVLKNAQRKDLASHYGKDSTCWSDLITGRKKSCYKYTRLSS